MTSVSARHANSSCAIRRALTFDVVQVLRSSSVIIDYLRDAPCRVAPAGRPISPPNPPHSTHASCAVHTHLEHTPCSGPVRHLRPLAGRAHSPRLCYLYCRRKLAIYTRRDGWRVDSITEPSDDAWRNRDEDPRGVGSSGLTNTHLGVLMVPFNSKRTNGKSKISIITVSLREMVRRATYWVQPPYTNVYAAVQMGIQMCT